MYYSKIQCFKCDNYGHIARYCCTRPKTQATTAITENSSAKKESSENYNEFAFISPLSSNIPTNNDTQLIDSDASHHITNYREHLIDLKEKESHLQVIIGDDASYSIKDFGSTSFKLDFGYCLI